MTALSILSMNRTLTAREWLAEDLRPATTDRDVIEQTPLMNEYRDVFGQAALIILYRQMHHDWRKTVRVIRETLEAASCENPDVFINQLSAATSNPS